MSFLWYPSVKQAPYRGVTSYGGGATGGLLIGGLSLTAPADSGNGGGFSIDQGTAGGYSIGGESNSITSASTTYHLDTWSFADSGSGSQGDLTDFTTGNITVDCGSQGSHWPFHMAINVTSDPYGRCVNQIEWSRGSTAIGGCEVYGSNKGINGSNFNDANPLTLWTFLGNINGGGTNNGSTGNGGTGSSGNLVRGCFNPNSYGYKWYLFKWTDSNGSGTTGPDKINTGVQASFHMYGCRLNYMDVGGAVGSNKIWPSYSHYKYIVGTATYGHNPMGTKFYAMENDFTNGHQIQDRGGNFQACNDTGAWNYANWSGSFSPAKQIQNFYGDSNFGLGRRAARVTIQGGTGGGWTTMFEGVFDTYGGCGWRDFSGKRWWT